MVLPLFAKCLLGLKSWRPKASTLQKFSKCYVFSRSVVVEAMVLVAKECARAYPSLRIAINQTKQIHFKFIRCHIVSQMGDVFLQPHNGFPSFYGLCCFGELSVCLSGCLSFCLVQLPKELSSLQLLLQPLHAEQSFMGRQDVCAISYEVWPQSAVMAGKTWHKSQTLYSVNSCLQIIVVIIIIVVIVIISHVSVTNDDLGL